MPRQKNVPDVVSRKMELAQRLKQIRLELFGQRGGPELARRLNLPTRTWYNYEKGVTIPGEILLDFLHLTQVPLHRFLAESNAKNDLPGQNPPLAPLLIEPDDLSDPGYHQPDSHRTTQSPPIAQMVVQTTDDSMLPSLPPGTLIGLGDTIGSDAFNQVEGQIVVAWHLETPVVRRLNFINGEWMLQADQPGWPTSVLQHSTASMPRIQRVLWLLRPARQEKRLALVHEIS